MGTRDEVTVDVGVVVDEHRSLRWLLVGIVPIALLSFLLFGSAIQSPGASAAMAGGDRVNIVGMGLLGLAGLVGLLRLGLSTVHHTRIQVQRPYLRISLRSILRREVDEIPLDRIERVCQDDGTPGVRLEADGRVFSLAAHAPVPDQRRLFIALQQASTRPPAVGGPDEVPVEFARLAARQEPS